MSHWGGVVNFGSFEFKNGKEITIRITYAGDMKSYEVLPIKKLDLLKVKKTGKRTIEIKTNRADQNITVIVNGERCAASFLQQRGCESPCGARFKRLPLLREPEAALLRSRLS